MEPEYRPVCLKMFSAPLMTIQIPNDPIFSSADHSTVLESPQFKNFLLQTISHLLYPLFLWIVIRF